MEFVCECSEMNCRDQVKLTLEEYEEIRRESTHFAVRPGHENGEVESAVWSTDRFIVVEKEVAEVLLEATDPRS